MALASFLAWASVLGPAAVRVVAAGGSLISPRMTRRLIEEFATAAKFGRGIESEFPLKHCANSVSFE